MLEAALLYASWGWHIHPLRPGEKRPLLKDWPRRASTDPQRIRAWWRRWPRANVGLACGPSGLLAVDLDVREGVDGPAAWRALLAGLGLEEPATPGSDTPSGGRHLLFSQAEHSSAAEGSSARNTAGRLGPGIDTRGDGGYVVLPPSRLAGGGAWRWRPGAHPRDCPPAPVPGALWERLVGDGRLVAKHTRLGETGRLGGERAEGEGGRRRAAGDAVGRAGAYGRAALRGELARVAGAAPGTRNDTLNAAAFALGQLVGGGLLDRGQVEEALVDAAVAAGLGQREARATAHSGLGAGERVPRVGRLGAEHVRLGETGRLVAEHVRLGEIGEEARGGGERVAGEPGGGVPSLPGEVALGEGDAAYLLAQSADDEGNALCTARLHGGRLLHCDAYGWLHYTGSHWTRDQAGKVLDRAIVATLQARRRLALRAERPALARASRPMAYRVKATARLLRSLLPAGVDEFDASPDLLNVANGVLDLRTGALAPHDAAQRFTYCLAVSYDPGADYGPWQAWLRGTLAGGPNPGSPDLDGPDSGGPSLGMAERYLQLAVGYSLTGHTREEVLFYLYGPPRSGKGTFTEALLTLLGHEPLATEVDFATFTRPRQHDSNSADLAKLKPCRLVVASEPNADDWLNAAQVKRLTGGNSVYAALKYHDHFVYRPAYKIWLTGNYPPRADVDDDGVWSRLRVVRFPNSYLGREDRGLKQRMKAPAMQRQILAWAVEGARAWYALGARGLATPPGVEAAGRAARQGLDSVRGWLAAHVVVTGAVDDFVANGALYGSYVVWCDAEGVRPQSQMALTRALQAKGLRAGHQKWCNGKNRRGCLGIRLAGEGPNT